MSPTADVSVRVAWAADAPSVAACQVRAWNERYAGVLPPQLLAAFDTDSVSAAWASSLDRPGDARNRVLVALERASVRGFAAIGPSADPDTDPVADGEITELSIDPGHRGAGHGSRLLQACADTMRADGFTRATWWVVAADDTLRSFVTATGWTADGAYRELDLSGDGQSLLKQVRLHTDLTEQPADGPDADG